jgi:hypothetical protein
MNALRELLPAGLGVAVVGVVTYLALDRGWAVGPWLLGLVLLAHGWVHAMFLFPAPDPEQRKPGSSPYPFRMSDSWLIKRAGFDETLIRTLGLILIGLTVAAFLLAALASAGWLVPASWWGPLVVAAATLSTVLLLVFLSPLLLLGFVINAALIWLVLVSVWTPGKGGPS